MRLTSQKHHLQSSLHAIADGNEGVKQTLLLMSKLVKSGKKNLEIRTLAGNLTKALQQKHWLNEIISIQKYVRDNIRYVRDIRGVETIQTPDVTLKIGYGDCDDKSTLVASLLESIGHPTRFVAVGFNSGNLSHVFVETKIGNKWMGVETTEPVECGWVPPNSTSKMIVHN